MNIRLPRITRAVSFILFIYFLLFYFFGKSARIFRLSFYRRRLRGCFFFLFCRPVCVRRLFRVVFVVPTEPKDCHLPFPFLFYINALKNCTRQSFSFFFPSLSRISSHAIISHASYKTHTRTHTRYIDVYNV